MIQGLAKLDIVQSHLTFRPKIASKYLGLFRLLYSSTSIVQRLEISRVQSLEISRFCILEISRRCTVEVEE